MHPSSPGETADRNSGRLFVQVPIDSLVAFRVWLGMMMMLDVASYFRNKWIDSVFIEPAFLFKYYGFEWIHPWPGAGMYLHFAALLILAGCMTLGLFYRVTSLLFATGITYVFLLEQAIYLNHLYLICLLSWLIVFVPCHCSFSLDVLRNPSLQSSVAPAWSLWLIRFQVGLPYFFGGIAKLERDWLSGDTVHMFFYDDAARPIVGPYLTENWVIMSISWGGMLLDLLIVPLLLWRRTRPYAFVAAVLFHLSNSYLFNIGIFPWMMIGATTIFFSPDWPRRLFRWPSRDECPMEITPSIRWPRLVISSLLAVYVLVQLALPLRQFAYPDNPSWSEEGHRFSWRMMLRKKITKVEVLVVDEESGRKGKFDPHEVLTPMQAQKMSRSPDMLLQFAHYLERRFREQGMGGIAVHIHDRVSLNGREAQLLIDPSVDLTEQQRSFRHAEWIIPLDEDAPSLMRQVARKN
ncbi:MAG: HTTM domain-containing protein [Planctomycetaceae bacterium]|nr:HTTM domain-containing protein [Planctomycetaceae bacterium]